MDLQQFEREFGADTAILAAMAAMNRKDVAKNGRAIAKAARQVDGKSRRLICAGIYPSMMSAFKEIDASGFTKAAFKALGKPSVRPITDGQSEAALVNKIATTLDIPLPAAKRIMSRAEVSIDRGGKKIRAAQYSLVGAINDSFKKMGVKTTKDAGPDAMFETESGDGEWGSPPSGGTPDITALWDLSAELLDSWDSQSSGEQAITVGVVIITVVMTICILVCWL